MIPIRETVARAIYKGMFEEGELIGEGTTEGVMLLCGDEADAVLRALDEAGLVVVPKQITDAMAWAVCPIVEDDAGAPPCKQCPATVEHNGKTGVMGCRGHYADIYRAMIAASVVE